MKASGIRKLLTVLLCLAVAVAVVVELWVRIGMSGEFQAEAEEALREEWGGPSRIGKVSSSALAGGVVTFRDIVLGSPVLPGKDMVRLETVRINGDATEFLQGRLVIEDLLIDGGVIDIERLQDTSLASLATSLIRALPEPPVLGTQAQAGVFSNDDITINQLRIKNLRIRFTDHHTHKSPVLVEVFPVNAGATGIVYPYTEGTTPVDWWLKAAVETEAEGHIEVSGTANLYEERPSFSADFEIWDIDALKVGEFIPSDLDTHVYGGRLGFSGQATCDRGILDGEWVIRAKDLDADVNEVLFGWDSKVSRLLIEYLGKDFQLDRIPLDCGDLYDPRFEIQECLYSRVEARAEEAYGPAIERIQKGIKKASDIFGGLFD